MNLCILLKRMCSWILCGTFVFALIPRNVGISIVGVSADNGFHRDDGLFSTQSNNKTFDVDNDTQKSEYSEGYSKKIADGAADKKEEKDFLVKKGSDEGNFISGSKNLKKEENKSLFINKGDLDKAGDNLTTNSVISTAAKVGGGVASGALLVKGSEFLVNKISGKDKKIVQISKSDFEKMQKELEQTERERDDAISKNNVDTQKQKDECIPGNRAYVWGFFSFPLGWLGLFGENKESTEILALHSDGLRLMFSIFWLVVDAYLIFRTWFTLRDDFTAHWGRKIVGGIGTALAVVCPPIGAAVLVSASECFSS